jgi:hypothetical protein
MVGSLAAGSTYSLGDRDSEDFHVLPSNKGGKRGSSDHIEIQGFRLRDSYR